MLTIRGVLPEAIAKMTKRQFFAAIQEIDEEKLREFTLAGGTVKEEEDDDGIWL